MTRYNDQEQLALKFYVIGIAAIAIFLMTLMLIWLMRG